ncbi:MAG TPA: hypothetical protein VNL15_00790 [Dehalococcoidia bacterium]|nr:hypothetical protein [Dehalococcoidia bacterium]
MPHAEVVLAFGLALLGLMELGDWLQRKLSRSAKRTGPRQYRPRR